MTSVSLLSPGDVRAVYGIARFLSLVWSAARQAHNENFKRAKFIVRALVHWRLTWQWLSALSLPNMECILAANPRLAEKLQRPYLHRWLSKRERLELLSYHYRFLNERLGRAIAEFVHASPPQELVELRGARQPLTIALGTESCFEKEGELTLALLDTSGRRLMSATFSIGPGPDNRPALFIGCLQGPAGPEGLSALRVATRDLHGLRPSSAMVEAIQLLARQLGASHIRAVSDRAHVYTHPRYWLRDKGRRRCYDEGWREAGGALGADGWWTLPLEGRRKSLSEIASNKRALYRRRYAMLEEMAGQLSFRLGSSDGASALPSSGSNGHRKIVSEARRQ